MIEVPLQTDTAWPGHRFALNSAISHRSLDLGTSINAPKLSKQLSNLSFASSFRNLSGTDIFRSGTRGASMTGGMDPRTPKSVRWVNGLVGDALGLEKWLGCVRFGLEVVVEK